MHSISQRLDQIARFANDECAHEIIQSGSFSSQARRHVLRLIMKTPGLPAYLYDTRIAKPYRDKGMQVIGSGVHAVAVASGETSVKKYYPETTLLSETEKSAYISALERKQQLTSRHLGSFVLLQDYTIEQNPLAPDTSVVTATQARVSGVSMPLRFLTSPPNHPAMAEFLARSIDMRESASSLPDIVGNRNLFSKGDHLVLVDPIALEQGDPTDHETFATADSIVTLLSPYERPA